MMPAAVDVESGDDTIDNNMAGRCMRRAIESFPPNYSVVCVEINTDQAITLCPIPFDKPSPSIFYVLH